MLIVDVGFLRLGVHAADNAILFCVLPEGKNLVSVDEPALAGDDHVLLPVHHHDLSGTHIKV